ncbi:bifunctional glycosyltransferase/CDP-glycerol:glycerophosphate glycerophosphotransferase [Leuconostoc palmae]|uniref:bifunctional glycosyltransferase/CDP-glycerol:glycerophosphate glycerophosphotransferase n=1 Tax=Leuconostoc palmae TaxID=501487 RepID=UPI001C7DF077|nr:CDP-glycerol glycerophosphotransferase family protein [Leuconostoc palmae]
MIKNIVHIPKNNDVPVTIVKKSHRDSTKLSVIVPMYNVALFLREALDSLLRQGIDTNYQVILIDDGSKDTTPDIAREYVDKYPNIFELYLFENGGLGAARNRGTNLAEGEFITYVDPDDIVVDYSYRKMLSIITRTGSDLIGGAVRRFNSKGETWTSYVHNQAYHDSYEATTLEEHPEMVWDSTAWNKIYRLEFILKYSLYFPEKMLYEDMPTVVPMYSLAKKIDILDEIIYLWRARDAGAPSITQSTGQIKNFTDRIKGMKIILNSLTAYDAPQKAQDEQLHKMLDFDLTLPFTYDNYLVLDQSYKDAIYTNVKSFLDMLTTEQFNQARYWYRALYTIWLREPKNVVEKAIETYAKREFHITFDQKTQLLHSSFQDDFNFELPTFVSDFESRTRLYSVSREGNNLILEGHLYYGYLDINDSHDRTEVNVEFVNKDSQIMTPFTGTIEFTDDDDITAYAGFDNTQTKVEEPAHYYKFSHYRISLPFDDLSKLTETAYIQINQKIHGLTLKAVIAEPLPGDDPRPEGYVYENDFLLPNYSSDWRFKIERFINAPVVVNYKYKHNNYFFEVHHAKKIVALWDKRSHDTITLEQVGNRYSLSSDDKVRLGEPTPDAKRWWQIITTDDISDVSQYDMVRMTQPIESKPHTLGSNMSVFHVSNHVATLALSWEYPIVKSVNIVDNHAKIQFWIGGWTKTANKVDLTFESDKLPNRYAAKKLTHIFGFGDRYLWEVDMPLSFGLYEDKLLLHPEIAFHFDHREDFTMPLRWGKSEHSLLNQPLHLNKLTWRFKANDKEEHRQVIVQQSANRLGFEFMGEKVAFWQEDYLKYLKEPILEKTVVYASLWGDKFNDNPRAIYDYLQSHYPEFEHIIVLKNVITDETLPNAKFVSFDTKEYWYYLARAKYFVNNVNFEENERIKRPEQIELQTMHGTPLKSMGFNVTTDWSSAGYERYLKKNRNWDYLTVPSDFVAEIAKESYRHNAEVLKFGYPRNDTLFRNTSQKALIDLKNRMHLPTDKKIILYAPTWRKKGPVSFDFDYNQLNEQLPKDSLLIIKGHHLNTIIDVPVCNNIQLADDQFTIEDYYKVSDVMITDYSSTMFDFALLKKPMIFYVYDYEEYIASRGLNFDFKNDAPGPLVYSQEELIDALQNVEQNREIYSDKIKRFENKFIQYDKGNASAQIVESIFTNHGKKKYDD